MPETIKSSRFNVRQMGLSAVLLICAAALSGCGGGGDDSDTPASASASTSPATTTPSTNPGTSPTDPTTPPADSSPTDPTSPGDPGTPPTQNSAPTIGGTPLQAVVVAASYAFTPNASDANGDALAFSIANKPTWASFDPSTGRLSGTPTLANVGTYSGIVITVSDGAASRSLPAFSIAVTQSANGSAMLSWTAPTQNVDGSALTQLSGYRIYYGTSPDALTQTVNLQNGLTSYLVENLSPATWYFTMKAISNGVESGFSGMVSKTVI